MKEIRNWTAKRSGTGITINGRSVVGDIVNIHVSRIAMGSPDDPRPIATTAAGVRYRLAGASHGARHEAQEAVLHG